LFARLEIVHGGTAQPDRTTALGAVADCPGFAGGYLPTELLDGEDPALLTGPDRVDVHRVVDHATAHAHTEPQSIEETVS
jgi:hypothetical protein